MDSLLDASFYGGPIALEPEPGLDLVGVRIFPNGLNLEGLYIVAGFDEMAESKDCAVFPLESRWKYSKMLS